MLQTILRPSADKINDKKIQKLFAEQFFFSEAWKKFQKKANDPIYKSWQHIRYSSAIPNGMTAEEAFVLLSVFREASAKTTPIIDQNGKPFVWEELSRFRFFSDDFAKNFGVNKKQQSLSKLKKEQQRKKIFEGTVEEAIASSQIEGAVITRKQGKELLASGRTPKTNAEKMVFNNYHTIVRIENEWKHRDMSKELLLEIQQSLTHGTLEDTDQEGRFRTDTDQIVVADPLADETAFVPPSQKQMRKQLLRLIDFANDQLECEEYFGELARAIMLHFWIGYLHPFCDGNGRTARALFYWYLLRKNYLFIGFLPISTRIRISKRGYNEAFLLTEQDNNNLTYFFDYILRQLRLSVKDFEEYEHKLASQERQSKLLAEKNLGCNERQLELLRYFAMHPDQNTTFRRHQTYHNISYITSRNDILDLVQKGFLTAHKRNKTIIFSPTSKIAGLL